jgi:pyrroline-5-carboxylate reductase
MKVALLGTGTMGRAIASSLAAQHTSGMKVIACDKDREKLGTLPTNVTVVPPGQWAKKRHAPDVVIIAVKPQDIGSALSPGGRPLHNDNGFGPLWVSVAAGVSLARLAEVLSQRARICRVMPNIALTVGEGMSVFSMNEWCGAAERTAVRCIFSACGKVLEAPEKLMNAVTGLSGSGPAYVFLFLEALIEGGVSAGLPHAAARECAIQTVIGAAKMAERNPSAALSQLKAQVMSPGGTTAHGLMALEKNRFKYAVIRAVTEATARAEQLGGARKGKR